MKLKLPPLFLAILFIILVLNLVQGGVTQLIFDEAYYWYYAQEMAWGYFDHPPMVALLIKISSLLLPGELGVRLMGVLLSGGTLCILWNTMDNPLKRDYIPHFFVLALSMPLLHAYGFLTLPDTPLLFFTALFFLVYKKFINQPSISLGIGLGIIMAGLMYSKYHAILIIVFVLLSNPGLFLNRYAWASVGVSLVCYLPHLNWLYQNNFVSLKYHLFERPNGAYDFEEYTLGYFLNLIALFGLTFPWIYLALFRTRLKDLFTRGLLFVIYGILLFFFISSFNRRIQTQWLIVVCVPLVIIVYEHILHHQGSRKWIFRAGIANIVILCFLRAGLVYRPLFPIVYETHGNREWVNNMAGKVGQVPVVFENSYRYAPMYAFYSGNVSYSLNTIRYRQNQYSMDDSEERVQHRRVFYVTDYITRDAEEFPMPRGRPLYGIFVEDFESFRKLRCAMAEKEAIPGGRDHIFKVYNPYNHEIAIDKLEFGIAFLNDYRQVNEIKSIQALPVDRNTSVLKPRDSTAFITDLPVPGTEQPAYLRLTISENGLYWGLNGSNMKLR